jgi:hypothetical protein
MANRKATFAKRQREADLKDRAKQKEDRRNQKRGETRDTKGPTIAWDEAVHASETAENELPPLGTANQQRDQPEPEAADAATAAPPPNAAPASSPDPVAPRRAG